MSDSFGLVLSLQSWLFVLCCICVYFIAVAVYRLYFSPLAKFPGPKLAALTYGVEFYHDVVRRGQYTFEILKMHEKYGPIVRITPEELHINDPAFLDEIYPGSHKPMDKPHFAAGAFGNSQSVLSTIPHHLHRMRRNPLNPFFSKRAVTEYASFIESCVTKLCARLEEFHTSQKPVEVQVAYSALTLDVITLYCLGRSYGSLEKPDFDPQLGQGIASGGELRLLLKQFPWILNVFALLPSSIALRLNRNALGMVHRRRVTRASPRTAHSTMTNPLLFFVDLIIELDVQALMRGDRKGTKETGHPPAIFQQLLDSDIPAQEKSMNRLVDEGITFIGAGSVTTAHVLSTITYHVLANPEIFDTMQRELQNIKSDDPEPSAQVLLVQLEQLPYLTAIITEGLRLAHGIVRRAERVAPGPTKLQEWVIPPGTVISMSAYMIHMNPIIFPNPQEFQPERWLASDAEPAGTASSKRHFMPFGKGSRICLGMNLAYAELYLTLEAVFRRFELKLFETTRADIDVAHDFVAGTPRVDSKGVRVLVRKRGD